MSLLPISRPVAEDAPASFVGSPISPALRAAYLDWRRVNAVADWANGIYIDLPTGEEGNALGFFIDAIISVEQKLRDAVLSYPASAVADRLLKLRCQVEHDDEILENLGGSVASDLIHLTTLMPVAEPAVAEHPKTDADLRDALTAQPHAMRLLPPAALLRLFTPEEGSEVFALATAYYATMGSASPERVMVLKSLAAYGAYVSVHDGWERRVPDHVPGWVLTDEERADLARLGRLSDSAIERLNGVVEAHRAEVAERSRRQEEEQKAKKAAEERAKHGPPLRERLVPLLPSFSEEARDSAVRIIYGASMIAISRVMLPEKADTLSDAELEGLRRLDFSTLKERFEPGCEQALHEEIDRLLGMRRSAPTA